MKTSISKRNSLSKAKNLIKYIQKVYAERGVTLTGRQIASKFYRSTQGQLFFRSKVLLHRLKADEAIKRYLDSSSPVDMNMYDSNWLEFLYQTEKFGEWQQIYNTLND